MSQNIFKQSMISLLVHIQCEILCYNLQDISIWVYHILNLACNLVLSAAQNFLETGPFLSLTRSALTRSC